MSLVLERCFGVLEIMIYEYRCGSCDTIQEVWQKMSDPAPEVCSHCKEPAKLERVISATSFALKGTGWYTTDYKRSGSPQEKTGTAPALSETTSAAASPEATPKSAGDAGVKKTES